MKYINSIVSDERIQTLKKQNHEEIFAFFAKESEDGEFVLVGSEKLSSGGFVNASINESVFNKTMRTCKELKADGLILLHNHPKSLFNLVLKPSEEDLDFTVAFYCMAKGHKIKLLDHLIVGSGQGYYSFKEHDLI